MNVDNSLDANKGRVHEALALHGVTVPEETVAEAALEVMLAEADHRWSMALWSRPQHHDLRLAATRARRERIDAVIEPLFG